MAAELPTQYEPKEIEGTVQERWLDAKAFAANPDDREGRYVIMMPLPNVTGALHMGHAMDNVMQDLLIRWHRMMDENTLWLPGTDHAGIATQAVVEKRLFELEGKTRHDLGREGLLERIWEWKEVNQKRIIRQQQSMGCSCDWDRQRFTMDKVCARAVRQTFFSMFADGLIYRGNRLVNWDCRLQTAVSDDEIVYEQVAGHFWHLRYPVIDPRPGEPQAVVVATTRPETMLGDTAVACHPDPAGQLEKLIADVREKIEGASDKELVGYRAELENLEERKQTQLPLLDKLAAMARDGRMVNLPLLNRSIPLILDEWAKPEKGSGCVKITPAHDPNDYEVWTRHQDEIGCINILNPDGTLNQAAGVYEGLGRFEGREQIVADLKKLELLAAIEDHEVEIGHSDRSKTPIEPYLSRQWFICMGDREEGVCFGQGTDKEFKATGLAQAAMDAVQGDWRTATGRKLVFHPDPERYANTYLNWLAEKRDWCISRQLWWGHRIPIWAGSFAGPGLERIFHTLQEYLADEGLVVRIEFGDGTSSRLTPDTDLEPILKIQDGVEIQACLLSGDPEEKLGSLIEDLGLVRDPDVLDTWFSSALWPQSTLGWPDPETAQVEAGQSPLGSVGGADNSLDYYYPGSCLVTGRDIITLWVARMIMAGFYNLGDLPFTDVFIHATILDGKGQRMSKSKGNGIDPVDIIDKYGADAMRYVVCELQTGTQDVRLPVQAISPFSGEYVDLATAKHGSSIFTYLCPQSGKEFDVLGTMPGVPAAKLVSDRFEVGRAFCNKLWNAARFTLMNLEEVAFSPLQVSELPAEDRWILSRLSRAITTVNNHLESYNPSAAIAAAREFFWSELCDWYLELIKPRMRGPNKAVRARQVLAYVLDQVLRLFHPFVPFITEAIFDRLNQQAPERGIEAKVEIPALIINAAWPERREGWEDDLLEDRFFTLQAVIRSIRDIRAKYGLPPTQPLAVTIRAKGERADNLAGLEELITQIGHLDSLTVAAEVERSPDAATAEVRGLEVFVAGVVDIEKEKARLTKQRDKLVGRITGSEKKLANEKFLAKAKPEVVERERGLLADLKGQLENLEANLKAL